MLYVRNVLLQCHNLRMLELHYSNLGYDGILFICSALRNNKKLKHLMIDGDCDSQPAQARFLLPSFVSESLPDKCTCTEFIMELNNILKDNTNLQKIYIKCTLFRPLNANVAIAHNITTDSSFRVWKRLRPLEQFNLGLVASGRSPKLRRSFSSSDITQLQTTHLQFHEHDINSHYNNEDVNFKELFAKTRENGRRLLSVPSFTAPDTPILHSFSGLDPRLKECLGISNLDEYTNNLNYGYKELLNNIMLKLKIDKSYYSDLPVRFLR